MFFTSIHQEKKLAVFHNKNNLEHYFEPFTTELGLLFLL